MPIGGHLGFLKGSPVWMASLGLNMVSGLRSFHVSQAAKQSLGPLSSGPKNHGTHNASIFPGWNFMLFQLGKILCFKPSM